MNAFPLLSAQRTFHFKTRCSPISNRKLFAGRSIGGNMTRQEMIDALLWSDGGAGYGICVVGNMLAEKFNAKEIKSCVTVQGNPDDYTDEELQKLVEFSTEQSEKHRRICGSILSSDNLIILRKQERNWLSKRRTWECGRMFSDTLDEAILFLSK